MNLFYLIVGLLLSLVAITRYPHWRGKKFASELKESNVSEFNKAELTRTYHQITITFLLYGIALVVISIFDTVTGIDLLAVLILSLLIAQFAVFPLIYLGNYRSIFKQALGPAIAYVTFVILIILGIIF